MRIQLRTMDLGDSIQDSANYINGVSIYIVTCSLTTEMKVPIMSLGKYFLSKGYPNVENDCI